MGEGLIRAKNFHKKRSRARAARARAQVLTNFVEGPPAPGEPSLVASRPRPLTKGSECSSVC